MNVELRAHELLHRLAGKLAAFREGQLEAIRSLVVDRARLLVVQRTGWGKSAVYLITTKILREAGEGPTILISPLLSLMRNQIAMADRLGVQADTINSSNEDEWERVEELLDRDEVDLLLVSPERFSNQRFRERVMPVIQERVGMVVIDEVHCISDWGHDFRPDYLQLKNLLARLPPGVPVVGTTATANNRVVLDVSQQLGSGLVPQLGRLPRPGLRLHTFTLRDPAVRMAWLVQAVQCLPGTGIVYCLTKRDVDRLTSWLRINGVDAVGYHSDTGADERVQIEDHLLENRLAVVVATSALGMGFDKPDLSYVIHYQSPGSPVAYYQQVGRAGRALKTSWGILLAGEEDRDIQDWFIKTAFPPRADAERVVHLLEEADAPVSLNGLKVEVNLGHTRLTQMLKVLEVEGAVERVPKGFIRTGQPWAYPAERFDGVTAARREEQRVMREYAEHPGCLMEYLSRQLDDPAATPCGVCMNCAGSSVIIHLDEDLVDEARSFLRDRAITIDVRKKWPDNKKIPPELLVEPGRALGEWGDGGWGPTVRDGKYRDGRFSDELVEASARLIGRWNPQPAPTWLTYVPSIARDSLVAGFAERLARALNIERRSVVVKVRQNRPQKEMNNSSQQYANIADAFEVRGDVPDGPVLLVDDIFDSQWTLTIIGSRLRRAGSGPVFPFVLAAAVGA